MYINKFSTFYSMQCELYPCSIFWVIHDILVLRFSAKITLKDNGVMDVEPKSQEKPRKRIQLITLSSSITKNS